MKKFLPILILALIALGWFGKERFGKSDKSDLSPQSSDPIGSAPSIVNESAVKPQRSGPAPIVRPSEAEEIAPAPRQPSVEPMIVERPAIATAPALVRAPRVAPDEPLLPGFVGPVSWRNLGTATPSAAFETHCWAIDRGDVDALLSTINPSPEARAKLKAIFERLPASDQANYGSPERMLAMMWVYHGLPFPGFMIQTENPRSWDEVGVMLQLQYNQQGAAREFVFTREADGWRKVTPDSQVDSFLRMTGISTDGHQ